MIVFFWSQIYKRDYLALFLGLELLGTFQFAKQRPPGRVLCLGTHCPHIYLLQGLEVLEFSPFSPSDLAPERQHCESNIKGRTG